MKIFVLPMIFLGVVPGISGAQPLYKCVQDTAVTYSSTSCEKLGLKSGGEIRDRVTTLPTGVSAGGKVPQSKQNPPPATGKENEIDMPKTSAVKPVAPMIEKLAK